MLLQPTVLGQAAPVPLSPEFAGLANTLYTMMLTAGFDPATSTVGGLFLMDVQTGEAVAFGDTLAFSGMSVNKIAILTQYFGTLDAPPNNEQAFTVAEAMVCSENISSNEMLASIGGGSPYRGAEQVSAFMQQLGLNNSFIFTPFANDPFITPEAPLTRTTDADQASTQPDPFNQITVSDVGNLLHSVHQCAYDESGPLLDNFDGDFTPTECRQILNVMTYNRIGTLIEVGVPADVPVAHKHGWINDTHGDAAIVFSPGGTYILVVALHAPQWLNFAVSAPLIEEISRTVYNHYNPDAPLAAVRTPEGIGDLAACNASLLGSPVIDNLMNPTFGQDTGSALG
jgi:beta-lactamase class A